MIININLKSQINSVLFFTLCFVCVSCNEKMNDEKEVNKVELGKIFYTTDPNLTTIKAVSCLDFMSQLRHSISYLPIKDSLFIKELKKHIEIKDNIEDEQIDVRYKIEIDSIVLCVDGNGYYTLNNVYNGKFSYFDNLLEYINLNKKYSTELEPLPIPDNTDW